MEWKIIMECRLSGDFFFSSLSILLSYILALGFLSLNWCKITQKNLSIHFIYFIRKIQPIHMRMRIEYLHQRLECDIRNIVRYAYRNSSIVQFHHNNMILHATLVTLFSPEHVTFANNNCVEITQHMKCI